MKTKGNLEAQCRVAAALNRGCVVQSLIGGTLFRLEPGERNWTPEQVETVTRRARIEVARKLRREGFPPADQWQAIGPP